MADQTEKIILELSLNSAQLLAELGKVKSSQRGLQAESKALQKDLDKLAAVKGGTATADYKALEVQLATNSRQLIGLSREAANLNKNLDATEAAAGSYNAMAAATAVLQKNLKEASVGVNITAEGFEELTLKVKEGLEAQRDFARGSGDMRALVGAYKEELGPSIEGVAAKLGVANDSLAAMQGLLKELKANQASISPVGEEADTVATQIKALEAQIEQTKKGLSGTAAEANKAQGSLQDLREELAKLTGIRETLRPGTAAMGDLNNNILNIQSSIQQAEGRIDEFGEKVKKNAQKENIDTLADAFGGVTAAITVASLFLGDNTNAEKLNAEAMRAVAVAQSLRSIQIGIASAKDAAAVVVGFVKNKILQQEVTATVAATTATVTNTAATEVATVVAEGQAVATAGQAVATEGATVAQTGLNTAMRLNPIGLVIIAVLALVAAVALLYKKFEVVRTFFAPLVAGFKAVASAAADALGLSDSAAEAAVAKQALIVDAIQTTAKGYELEAKRLELAGAALATYRAEERKSIVISYNATRDLLQSLRKLKAEYTAEGKEFSKEQVKQFTDAAVAQKELAIKLGQFDIDTKAKLEAEAKAKAAAAKTASETAKKLVEEQIKLQREQLQVQAGYVKIRLKNAVQGSNEERLLLIKEANISRQIELAQTGLTLQSKKLIQAQYQAEVLVINTGYARLQAAEDLAISKELLLKQIAAAGENSQAQLQLRRQLIATEQQLELAALDVTQQNAAKQLEIKRGTQDKLLALALQQEATLQDVLSKEQQQTVTRLQQAADLMLAGLNDGARVQVEASQGYLNARLASVAAAAVAELAAIDSTERQKLLQAGENEAEQTRIKREGEAARQAVGQQAAADNLNLQQETAQRAQAIEQAKYQAIGQLIQDSAGALSTIADAAQSVATAKLEADTARQLAGAGNDAKKKEKILADSNKQKERLEREYNEKRRRMAIVMALVNGALAITEILKSPAAPFVEPFASAVRAVQIGLVVGTTVAQVAALNAQKFARGGRVTGPSHAAGGVQMLHTSGHVVGEMEGDEIILTKGVYQNPLLRGLASTLNQLAGGASLEGAGLSTASVTKMAAGGVVAYDAAAFGPRGSSSAAGGGLSLELLAVAIGAELARAVANLPPSQVAVSEITAVQNKVAATAAAADIS